MAEVLVVIAIIVILAGVGFIALMSHMRNMEKLELDGQAKEIFVAAQNHLAMADSQGYLGKTGFGTEEDAAAKNDVYYYVVGIGEGNTSLDSENDILSLMLPFASVDESARTSGSYIIRYQKSTATVMDVFYAKTTGRYRLESGLSTTDYTGTLKEYISDNTKVDLKNYGDTKAVIGYYGGVEAASLKKGDPLNAPGIQIINADKLQVIVTENNSEEVTNTAGYQLKLVVTGVTSGATKSYSLSGSGPITLDDVTPANPGFYTLASEGFTPGEDIRVKAIASNNQVLTNIAESAELKDNSLFASVSGNTAQIGYFRHFLNLDKATSQLGVAIKTAEQTANLSWADFKNHTGFEGSCWPVKIDSSHELTLYDGKNKKISQVEIEGYTGDAGLFSTLNNCDVENLTLEDFNIETSSGNAGALAGTVTGGKIESVLVHNTILGGGVSSTATAGGDKELKIEGTGAVGGLVGSISGTNVTVETSAAAVYVHSTDGVAGGLIGALASGSITVDSSYAGGHTEEAHYASLVAEAGTSPLTSINVLSDKSHAGGLVGDAGSASLTLQYSYSTASAATKATAATVGVGGLVGNATGTLTATNCYAAGLVDGKTEGSSKASISPLIGIGSFAESGCSNVQYMSSVSPLATEPSGYSFVSAVSAGTTGEMMVPADQGNAVPYDRTLALEYKGKYTFATVKQLGGKVVAGITDIHYGDWYLPNMEILYYTIVNDNTLYTEITLKEHTRLVTVAVYGETSKAAKAFLLEVAEDKSSVNLIDMGTLVGNDIRWTGTPAAGTNLPDYGISGTDTKKVTVTMDDITTEKKHFASIFPDLLPGENITVLAAGGNCGWPELQTLRQKTYPADMEGAGRIIALSDNSLFAKPTDLKNAAVNYSNDSFKALLASVSNAEIINIRHLQNLDTSVSNVNADSAHKTATAAKLMNDINWTSEEWNDLPAADWWLDHLIYRYNSSTYIQMGHFNGIVNTYLTKFDGNDKTIKGMVIGNTFGEGAGHAGFFRRVDNSELTIQKLHLDSPTITAQSGSAGAFIGLNNGNDTKLDTVLAEGDANYEIKALSGSAGGLVGYSQRTLNITNSAGSMLVTGSGAAGGLVGQQTGDTGELKISKSYVGGHTYGGVYYVNADAAEDTTADVNGVDADSHERWNVISTGGAAGGLLGLLDAKATLEIEESFNAASVYSGAVASTGAAGGIIGAANGTISKLNLVYVVAPVSDVKEIKEVDDELVPEEGNAGSVIGISSKEFEANSSAGSGVYFLANVYSTPMPTMLDTSVSNIKTIGSGTLKNIKLAYYYVKAGQDNAILPYVHSDIMEQRTDSFDGSLGEYPFAIWTKFAFDGSDILHFYGDWQPAEKGPTIHLDVEFYTVLPADETTGAARVAKHLTARDQEIAVQIPYEGAAIQLPWPEDVFNYNFGDWAFYYGEQGSKVLSDSAIDASDTSATVFSKSKNGFNVYMPVTDFKKLNQDKYKTTDENGETHLHITLVSTYVKRENLLYKLEFFDDKFKTTAEGTEELDGFESDPLTYQVLEPQPNEDHALAKVTLDQLVEGKQPPTRNKAGFRFLGWYLKNGENYTPIYENVFNSAANSFGLVLNETEAAKVTVDHDIQLYARYEAIPYRTINITFVDGDGNQIPSVEPYQIRFEGDRGFKETVIPLPYTENILYPDAEQTPVVTGKSASDTIEWTLTGANPTVKIAIVPVSAVTDSNREINCKVTYNVQADYTGYVVLYEFMDTGTDGSTYAAGQSYVHQINNFASIKDETYLYGATIKGFSPDIDVSEDTRFASYMESLQPAGFEISGDRFVKQDNSGNLPEKYAGKYPSKVKNSSGEDIDVTCLVVIQCKRKTNWLTFDSDGGTIISPVKLTYGRKLSDIMMENGAYKADYIPTYASYTFTKWIYTENGVETDVTSNTTMPAHDLELRAKREGAPVPFTVLLMEQDPNNDAEYTVSKIYTTYGRSRTLQANAGSDISVSLDEGQKKASLSWRDGTSSETVTYTMLTENAEYRYFNLNSTMTDATVSVSDDGSTLVKIYLDRNFYSVWFRIGRASNAKVSKKVGKFDDEAGTHELFEYIRPNGEHFWAYEDEAVGVPYGTENNRWFELTKDTKDVPVYKPEGIYSPETNPDAAEPLFGISGGYYVTLHKEGGYAEVSTRSITENDYYGKVNENYVKLTYGGRDYLTGYGKDDHFVTYTSGYTYDVTTSNSNNTAQYGVVDGAVVQLTRRGNKNNRYWVYIVNGQDVTYNGTRYVRYNSYYGDYFFDGTMNEMFTGYVFTWRNGNTDYSWVLSTDRYIDNYDTILGGTHYFSSRVWKDSSGNTYANNERYSRTDYPANGEEYEAEDLEPVGNVYYFYDGRALVATEDAGTKTVPIFKRKDTEEVYDHKTKPVKYFVIITNPKDINVQDVVPTTNTQYFVSIYSSNGYAWNNQDSGVTTRVNAAWNNNPFTWIPSKNLRLEGPETSNGDVYFYYCICARFGADISKVWPDVNWLNGEGRNAGIMGLVETSNGNRIRDYKFTSWLFPDTSRYYYLHTGTMTSIKGPYATMSEELILKRSSSYSTTFFDTPDNGTGNNPSVILYGRYRHNESNGRPYWWNYVIHFGIGGLNPNPDALDTRNPAHWRTVEVHVYSDGPSGNQNPIEYQGFKTPAKGDTTHWTPQSQQYTGASTTQWKDIDYYYIPEVKHILFNAKDDPEGQYDVIADDSYFYGTNLKNADIHSDEVNVPTGYVFKGWYQNSLGEGTAFDFDSDIHGELILYAVVEPVDKSVTFTLTKPEGCEADPVWAEGGSENRTFTGIKHKSTLTAALTEDGRSFTPKLEGYRFVGWVEQEEPHTPFAPSQQIIKNYTLIPSWEKLPEPVKINVTVYYVEQDDPDKEVHASTTEEAVVDDSHKFTALNIDGYKPVKAYYYETIDNAWLEEHKVAGTENQYEVTFYYIPADNTWNYTVQYNLYLTPVNGGAAAEIPLQTGTETSSSNFAAVSFFTLPDNMKGYKVANLKLFEGSTQVDSTTDPIIFVKKAENVTLVVNVVPDDSLILQGEVVRTYNAKPQGVESEFESSLPTLPSGVAFVRTVAYTYNGSETKPTNVGAYQVGVTVTVTYNDVVYFYWESATASASRPDMVLYIDPCDVIVTSESVTNVFLNTAKNQKDKTDGKLPAGAVLANIVQNLTAGAAEDTNVGISVSGSDSTDILAKLNGSDGLLISPSADAFRRAGSKGPDDYTTNTFYCEMKNSTDNANFNFYKVYGKLYIWEDLDAYNKWKNPGT